MNGWMADEFHPASNVNIEAEVRKLFHGSILFGLLKMPVK